MAAITLGCKDEAEPCYGLEVGERLEVEVVEHYDPSSWFTGALQDHGEYCPDDLDLSVGDVAEIRLERQVIRDGPATCWTSLFVVENSDEVGWQEAAFDNSNVTPIPFLFGRFAAVVGGCAPGISLAIDSKRPTSNLMAVSEPAMIPSSTCEGRSSWTRLVGLRSVRMNLWSRYGSHRSGAAVWTIAEHRHLGCVAPASGMRREQAGYVRATFEGHPVRWNSHRVVLYVQAPAHSSSISHAALLDATTKALRAWTSECSTLAIDVLPSHAHVAASRDGVNVIALREDRWCPPGAESKASCYDERLQALTQLRKGRGAANELTIVEADIELNGVHHQFSSRDLESPAASSPT